MSELSLNLVFVGAVYIDTILSVPRFPTEDEKLRATGHSRRRGGNCANTLEVLSQLIGHNTQSNKPLHVNLHLISVLPGKVTTDVQFIAKSMPGVEINKGCIFRENFDNAASSYIIQAAESNSRTIVSHNPLPEMTTQEFVDRASAIRRDGRAERHCYHFEGRIPTVTEQSVRWLCDKFPSAKISVECEKPDREYMISVSRLADVVFFSRIWAEVSDPEPLKARVRRSQPRDEIMFVLTDSSRHPYLTDTGQAKSYEGPQAFLNAQLPYMKPGAILVCTWGSQGAVCVHSRKSQDEENEWASTEVWKPTTGPMEATDTIGAGDTFIAGFLYALNCQEQWPLQRKLEFANELAGRKVLQPGFGDLAGQMGRFLIAEVKAISFLQSASLGELS